MKSKKKLYLIAGITSIIIYFLGVLTGLLFQSLMRSEISFLRDELESIRQEYLLLISEKGSCEILPTISTELAWKLESVASRLRASAGVSSEFENLKWEFGYLSIKNWLLRSAIKERCNETVLPILYFYSYPCKECQELENIFERLKKKYGVDTLLVYSLDINIDKPLVKTILQSYGIKRSPSFILNGKTYTSLLNETELDKIICKEIGKKCQ